MIPVVVSVADVVVDLSQFDVLEVVAAGGYYEVHATANDGSRHSVVAVAREPAVAAAAVASVFDAVSGRRPTAVMSGCRRPSAADEAGPEAVPFLSLLLLGSSADDVRSVVGREVKSVSVTPSGVIMRFV